ncbi:MAG: imidazole glycerol phosphate synthase subunit HisH [Pseudolabrys sp.]|nr:imidazole glycerol phosphate synthase subunit HisH [Pseudolabrys sp.]
MKIRVIDYGMGNIASVLNALLAVGVKGKIASSPADLDDADGLILPGVGAFGDAMVNLEAAGFVEALPRAVEDKPLLGICLGMQLLARESTEHGQHRGLGLIPGRVNLIPEIVEHSEFRVPHIGWNDVRFKHKSGFYENLGEQQAFYFVHSYRFLPDENDDVTGWCDYGEPFAACVERGLVKGVQFHPEKSHKAGLTLLRNWCNSCDA